jgi:chorismate synthase
MAGNSLGQLFRLTTFGESHGAGVGGVIDGCPAGIEMDISFVQQQLDRRKPGQSAITTQRKESDTVEILSGIYENKTTGAPIAFLIRNENQQSKDYDSLKEIFRPSHADYTYLEKYGIRDPRGGGRSSARAMASVVAAGAIAQLVMKKLNLKIFAFVSQVGKVKVENEFDLVKNSINDFTKKTNESLVRCPDEKVSAQMQQVIESARDNGDSLGGIISCIIQNCPVGLGEPVFDKLQADLAKAILSINATHGFEYGSGFAGASQSGSENNDEFFEENGKILTKTNNSGGIQGGISNGMEIYFRTAFKPTSSIKKEQQTVNTKGENVNVKIDGRHDPCVLPRAVPIVEAMAALVICDHWLRNKTAKIN